MKITFWGTRGSIAAPGPDTVIYGGNTTCVEVTLCSGRTVVIDAGTGIRTLGDALLSRGSSVEILLLVTHVHWDHLWGFPFFGPLFRPNTRISVDGCRMGLEGLKRVFTRNYLDGTWPIRFEDLSARIEPALQLPFRPIFVDSTAVESCRLHHPQGGLGFKFTEESGVFVFLTDNELVENGWKGASFKDFVKFCANADLLVHDCQYLPEELEIRKGWGHSDINSVAKLALEAGVKRLLLFHHDPSRTDRAEADMVQRCREYLDAAGAAVDADAAREGQTVEV